MTPTDATDATDLAQHDLPGPMAERSAVVLEAEEPPATLAEWTDALADLLDDVGVTVGPEDLCTTAESRHRATVDGTVQHYRCVLDALLVPFVTPDAERVDVRSRDPRSDAVVAATLAPDAVAAADSDAAATDPDAVAVEPETAVVSLGLAADAPPASELSVPPLEAYDLFCPYVNAFPDRETYAAWAEETPEAVTTAVPFEAALAVAERLAAAVGADASGAGAGDPDGD